MRIFFFQTDLKHRPFFPLFHVFKAAFHHYIASPAVNDGGLSGVISVWVGRWCSSGVYWDQLLKVPARVGKSPPFDLLFLRKEQEVAAARTVRGESCCAGSYQETGHTYMAR